MIRRYLRDVKDNNLKSPISLLSRNKFGIGHTSNSLAPMLSNCSVNHTQHVTKKLHRMITDYGNTP